MRLTIKHSSEYNFSSEVYFEPHFLRFKPRNTQYIQIESFKLKLLPNAAGISEILDPENNFTHLCWFDDLSDKLHIESELVLDSKNYNPYNFLISPQEYVTLPFEYSESLKRNLQASLEIKKINDSILLFATEVLESANYKTIDFLTNLTIQIHSDFKVESREYGSPLSAEQTFTLKRGSCRDLSWMMIQLLRNLGIAARFVSGYYYLPLEGGNYDLHAWVEVFIPGAGWIGFDPSHGIAASNRHIPVASSSHFENTMPVSGTIRGNATSDLTNNISIQAEDL